MMAYPDDLYDIAEGYYNAGIPANEIVSKLNHDKKLKAYLGGYTSEQVQEAVDDVLIIRANAQSHEKVKSHTRSR